MTNKERLIENNEKIEAINRTLKNKILSFEETDPTVPQYVKDITEQNIDDWNNKANKSELPTKVSQLQNDQNYATQGYVDTKVADLVNSAPETLDTLGEVAQAIEENADVVEALNSAVGNKANKSDLVDYVKNTDYATNDKGGVVKVVGDGNGVTITKEGVLQSEYSTEADINAKTSYRKPITPINLDCAIKVGLTTNTKTWTDEEKASARTLIDAIGTNEGATSTKMGLVSATTAYGVTIEPTDNYKLKTVQASNDEIIGKTQRHKPITPKNLDYAVKVGITTNSLPLTDEEKTNAKNWLGITGGGSDIDTSNLVTKTDLEQIYDNTTDTLKATNIELNGEDLASKIENASGVGGVTVSGSPTVVNFGSDPQTQIDQLRSSLSSKLEDAVYTVSFDTYLETGEIKFVTTNIFTEAFQRIFNGKEIVQCIVTFRKSNGSPDFAVYTNFQGYYGNESGDTSHLLFVGHFDTDGNPKTLFVKINPDNTVSYEIKDDSASGGVGIQRFDMLIREDTNETIFSFTYEEIEQAFMTGNYILLFASMGAGEEETDIAIMPFTGVDYARQGVVFSSVLDNDYVLEVTVLPDNTATWRKYKVMKSEDIELTLKDNGAYTLTINKG